MSLTTLPADILILVLDGLGVLELIALSSTCHKLHSLVSEFGWVGYLRSNPRPSYGLSSLRPKWSPRCRVQYDYLTDTAWKNFNFVARPLSRPWKGKLQPTLAISPSRLVVAAGSTLYSYKFGNLGEGLSPSIHLEGTFSFVEQPHEPSRNITGATFVQDGGHDRTLYVAFQDGAIERVMLMASEVDGKTAISATRTIVPSFPNYDFVESFSFDRDLLLSLSSTGLAKLENLSASDESSSSIIELKSRSWVSLLSLNSSTPYAAFGTSSTTPVAIHPITNTQLSSAPSAILYTDKGVTLPTDRLPSTAVYGLSHGPLSSPWGSSKEIVVTGWFDGVVRCYDLRSSTRTSLEGGRTQNSGPIPLRPVMSLSDKWSEEPIYSVSCGGGSSSHIAAGTARHSVVSFWDVRYPKEGWKVYAPGNDSSPVYSVILESSRFFGVTQSRPFVYDFGPGLTANTYPPLPHVRGMDGLKQKKNSLSFTVMTLPHSH
ncbi:uncharacterized protein LACBIDRAFT_292502 [Laccaria bicolor S238N-H82]|uniref:Predicted protein n=1 Tax=Laccaria bicolor (strain S238N-H82 / ATCC MYA-4686) TaxID=486041 RepID=B0CV57_LACBS|nr:uncharacterized protein LACBIDRAFT_292502 [Laccaria bicolor S238N-H82]EDR13272.1 predicted protein [Laccaria bicolor S238N-H82]|eukprot:XP_001875770.1 predicted protein [Laccaria bicolor S238N-H82]